MRLNTAIIQEDKLDEVRESLIAAETGRITVTRVDGHGQQEITEIYRGLVVIPNLIPKVEIKIAVNDKFVDLTVDTLLKGARHGNNGKPGDGKIFIAPSKNASASAPGNGAPRPSNPSLGIRRKGQLTGRPFLWYRPLQPLSSPAYGKAPINEGWAECNGSNANRRIIGAGAT